MLITEIVHLVLLNIKQNKFKVFLTSLGIIVGTATIVLVIAIGEGGKRDVSEQFKTLNAGTITVSTSSSGGGGMSSGNTSSGRTSGGGGGNTSSGRTSGGGGQNSSNSSSMIMATVVTRNLTQENLEDVLFFVPNLTAGAITASTSTSILGGNLEEAGTYTVVATESSYMEISNLSIMVGSFITDDDMELLTRGVILGYNVALEMFGSAIDAFNSKVEIDGRTYVVNGVLASMGSVVSGIAPDTSVFMPYSTAEKYLLGTTVTPQFSLLASDVEQVPTVIENVTAVLTQANPSGTYTVTDAGATMEAAMQSANTLSLLLMAVAVIVFIVGGIGIMNVLFVSVKERTREIGVLKAIGTKKRDVLMLFLSEASMIGVIGGLFGIALSFGLLPLMDYASISVVMTAEALILALGFAVITGTIFGFYPALKASNLVPIKALNNE